uniref:60S ribosomal protein L37a n=1 Tax=Felis catus TaxID=9685 RepID=A0ABI8AJL0_FELCA
MKIETSQHAKYICLLCGKTKMKRRAVGIWHRGSCMKKVAGGAGLNNTASAITVTSEGIKRPVEALPFQTLLAYNKWVNLCSKLLWFVVTFITKMF